jgi:beta-glucosidase/6-phospho-beta-glucosidase/beta-galactosidase
MLLATLLALLRDAPRGLSHASISSMTTNGESMVHGPRVRGLALFSVFVLAASACKKAPAPSFPTGFLWGISTSAEQSEGSNASNDWYAFEQMGRAPPVGLADDTWDRYAEDFANTHSIGANAFRFTLEWGRLMPSKPADPSHAQASDLDPAALSHYQAVFGSLASNGLTPIVTLSHYTLPIWVDNPAAWDPQSGTFTDGSLGGWTNPATAQAFASWAGLMAQTFGSQVHWWLTVNEPNQLLLGGFAFGVLPPGFTDLSLTATVLPGGTGLADVMRNLISAHALAAHAIKAIDPGAQVSFAHNSIAWVPLNNDAPNTAATARIDQFYNREYVDALTTGVFDSSLVGDGPFEQHPEWAGTLDFIGINYYAHDAVVSASGFFPPLSAFPCDEGLIPVPALLTAYGCTGTTPSQASGLTEIALEYTQRYHLPLLITENGADGDAEEKASFLVQNLLALHDAMNQGVEVLGYSWWTLDHDYEWNSGYTKPYGLYEIAGMTLGPDGGLPTSVDGGAWAPDEQTDFTRIPLHPVVDVYSEIAGTGRISDTLVAEYGSE